MKPAPADWLLGPGQTWVVVQAQGWVPATHQTCNERQWDRGFSDICRIDAVILEVNPAKLKPEALCEDHMGYHRWIQDGAVYQWKAEPPWPMTKKVRRNYAWRKRGQGPTLGRGPQVG